MKKILLIEDNIEIRENTAEILELDGYEVLVAENGKMGVEMANSIIPDLIICDIMMPILDGYGVLHLLSKNPDTENIPFIFLTAKADRTDFRKGMEMGADDYITKPFDDVDLLNAIESRFKKIENIQKKYQKDLAGLDEMVRDLGGETELQKLIENREKRIYKKKSEIYREGDYPLYLFFVEKGKIKTFKTNDDGKELILNLYAANDYLGYVNLIQNDEYSESATALEDCELTLIPKDDFNKLLFKNSHVATKFIRMLSNDIKENEDQLLKLAYNSVRKRVSECLLRFFTNADPNASIKIGREDLANMAGTSIETAIRTLSDFKDEKLIEISTGKIKILNFDKLKRLKN